MKVCAELESFGFRNIFSRMIAFGVCDSFTTSAPFPKTSRQGHSTSGLRLPDAPSAEVANYWTSQSVIMVN